MFDFLRVTGLFFVTAVAEIVGCYLPWLVLTQGRPVWWLLPAAASLATFAWLLTLHPSAAGRTYAAYGGVYVEIGELALAAQTQVETIRYYEREGLLPQAPRSEGNYRIYGPSTSSGWPSCGIAGRWT